MSLKEILEVNEINRESPIGLWKSLIETPDLMREELSEGLRYISAQYPPDAAEIVMNAACQFDCHHCIYPKDYPKFNKNLELRVWKEIFKGLYERLGFRTFVFGGRGLNKDTLEAVEYLKGFDDTKVGFIADGPQMERFLSQILESPADWIDVSVDGMAEQHDTQRKSPGSFYRSVEVLEKLLGYGRTPMVAIKVTNIKPALVVLHGLMSVDEIAKRIAEAENIPLAVCMLEKAEDINRMLRGVK